MNSVILGLNLLRKELLDAGVCTTDMLGIIGDILESSDVINNLVSDLLTQDKLEKGILTLDKRPSHTWTTMYSAMKPFLTQVFPYGWRTIPYLFSFLFLSQSMKQARQCGVNLLISEPEIPDIEDIYIEGDRHKLGQVIRNLLSNALKFTPSGGNVTVKTSLVTLPALVPNPMNVNSQHTHHFTNTHKAVSPVTQVWVRVNITDSGAGISLVSNVIIFLVSFYSIVPLFCGTLYRT